MRIRKKSNLTQQILELYSKKLTNKEIADILQVSTKKVNSDLNRNNLLSNKYSQIEETNELKQFILGSILGDGYLVKIDNIYKESRISFGHGLKQKDYCKYKHSLLDKYNLAGKFRYYSNYDYRFKNNLNENYTFKSLTNPLFTKYRNLFYNKEGKKYINREVIKDLNEFGLAIWFMDDGSKSLSGYNIYTCSFSIKDVLFLKQFIEEKFGLYCTYCKSTNSIYIKKKSVEKFTNLIKPYTITSMLYKLHKGPV